MTSMRSMKETRPSSLPEYSRSFGIDRQCRWIFPLLYFGLLLLMFGVAILFF
jgi:hypothetical protein